MKCLIPTTTCIKCIRAVYKVDIFQIVTVTGNFMKFEYSGVEKTIHN